MTIDATPALEGVVPAAPAGSRNAAALADLLRKHRAELTADLIDQWAPVLATAAGWRAVDRVGVQTWATNAATRIPAGWSDAQGKGEGLLIPYRNRAGEPITYGKGREAFTRLRLFPAVEKRKYLQPSQSGNHLYLPITRDGREVVAHALEAGYLIITEGELDAQWATFLGVPTVGLAGVDSFKNAQKRKQAGPDGRPEVVKEGSTPIPDLDTVPWCELAVYIVYDSDARTNPRVMGSRRDIANELAARGAQVYTADLPRSQKKMGLGDWLLSLPDDARAEQVAELRRKARRVGGPSLPGRRPGADPVPFQPPGDRPMIPDLTQLEGRQLEGLLAELEAEAQGADPGSAIPAAVSRLKQEKQARAVAVKYGLDLRGQAYSLGDAGLARIKGAAKDGTPLIERVTTRPVWVDRTGTDLATGARLGLLKWADDQGATRERWVSLTDLSTDRALIGDGARERELDALPVAQGNARNVSQWLTDAAGWLIDGRRDAILSSRTGWVQTPDGWRNVRPGGDDIIFVGSASPPRGSAEAWAVGLDGLLALQGDRLWQALVVLGLCAAAPIVRFVSSTRNPVIGLTADSSSGKGALSEYALAMYGLPSEGTYQAMQSTPKGLEAKSLALQDRPLRIDDAQTRGATRDELKTVEGWAYFLANGQSRHRAGKTGGSVGGELWHGVGIYLAEHGLADRFTQKGANLRVIELPHKPLENGEQAQILKRIAADNAGALADALYGAIGDPEARGEAVRERADSLRRTWGDSTRGDDLQVIALACVGLELLQEATGRRLSEKCDELAAWFGRHIASIRKHTPDSSTQAWEALLGTLNGAVWEDDAPTDSITVVRRRKVWTMQGAIAAWREPVYIDVNPHHPQIERLLEKYGGLRALTHAWAEAGLIKRPTKSTGHLLFQRRVPNQNPVRVIRIEAPVTDPVTDAVTDESVA